MALLDPGDLFDQADRLIGPDAASESSQADLRRGISANSPEWLRPKAGAANAKELNFEKLDSGYKVRTAGTKAVGRSSTIKLFHGSEVAFWPFADTRAAGILQAVPNEDNTEIILESAANGI